MSTKIQWTDETWNPWQGCQQVSPGCDNCYMFRDKRRYGQDPETVVRSKPPTFRKPLKWNREARGAGVRRLVFTASWADFFSREADEWRDDAWAIVRECDSLIFQILTKRHGRIAKCLPDDWGDGYPNVWLGVSAENQEWADRRIPALLSVPAAVRFVSYEPALGDVDFRDYLPVPHTSDWCAAHGGPRRCGCGLLDWLIVGGESGPGARPFDLAWARSTVAQCRRAGVPCFVKQLGSCPVSTIAGFVPPRRGVGPGRLAMEDAKPIRLRDRKGGDMSEWPEGLRIREMPEAT